MVIDGVVEFVSLLIFRLLDLSIVEVSSCNSGFIYFSVQLCQVLPHIIWCSVVRHLHGKDRCGSWTADPFVIIQCPSLYLVTSLALKSKMSTAATASFWLLSVWCVFLRPFAFNTYVSLHLKWVSCRRHIVRGTGNKFSRFLSEEICISPFLSKNNFTRYRILSLWNFSQHFSNFTPLFSCLNGFWGDVRFNSCLWSSVSDFFSPFFLLSGFFLFLTSRSLKMLCLVKCGSKATFILSDFIWAYWLCGLVSWH